MRDPCLNLDSITERVSLSRAAESPFEVLFTVWAKVLEIDADTANGCKGLVYFKIGFVNLS